MEKIYIDRRVTVNGRESIINLDNYLDLKQYINDTVQSAGAVTLTQTSPGYLQFDNGIDPPLTFKEGWTTTATNINGDLVVTYPSGSTTTIPIASGITANNGITKTGPLIELGGSLTKPTSIFSANHNLSFIRSGPTNNNANTTNAFMMFNDGGVLYGLSDVGGRSSAVNVLAHGRTHGAPSAVEIAVSDNTNPNPFGSKIIVNPAKLRLYSGRTTITPTHTLDFEESLITFDGENIKLLDFEETRDDTGTFTPTNFLYTSSGGDLLSAPLETILIDSLQSFTVDSSTIDFTITNSPATVVADVIPNTHIQKIEVYKAGVLQGTRKAINLIQGSNVTLTTADDAINDRVNITIAATGGGGGGGLTDAYYSFTDGTTTTTATAADTFKFRSANNILTAVITDDDITHGDNVLLTINQANIDHNALANYSANRHIDHSTVSVTAGAGLSGGGTIDASINIAHADTSSLNDTANSTNTVIQNLTFDTYGHVLTQSSKTFVAADFGIPTATIAGQIIYWNGTIFTVGVRIKNIQSPNGFSTFNLPHTPVSVLPVDVYINGVLKEEGVTKDYTLSGNTLTFNYTFQSTDKITTIYYI